MAFTNVVIHYGPFRGRAEPIRLALAAKGQTWTDVPADWAGMKSNEKYAFGQAPLFEFDGFDLVQSNAALRYVGRKLSLYGSSDEEAAEIDMYLDGCTDAMAKLVDIYTEKYSDEAVAKFLSTHVLPEGAAGRNGGFHLAIWDRFLKKAQGKGGFLVGGKLSIADIAAYATFENVTETKSMIEKGIAAKINELYPSIPAYMELIKSVPDLKAFMESEKRYPAN